MLCILISFIFGLDKIISQKVLSFLCVCITGSTAFIFKGEIYFMSKVVLCKYIRGSLEYLLNEYVSSSIENNQYLRLNYF